MTIQHNTLTGSKLHQAFPKGLDSAKSATPKVGDHYYATDTKILYQCQVADAWVAVLPASSGVSGTFDNGDLAAGKLTVTHSLGLDAPYSRIVSVVDNAGKAVDCPITFSADSFEIDLSDYGTLTGTWGYRYI
jgi:hypothetical protein